MTDPTLAIDSMVAIHESMAFKNAQPRQFICFVDNCARILEEKHKCAQEQIEFLQVSLTPPYSTLKRSSLDIQYTNFCLFVCDGFSLKIEHYCKNRKQLLSAFTLLGYISRMLKM